MIRPSRGQQRATIRAGVGRRAKTFGWIGWRRPDRLLVHYLDVGGVPVAEAAGHTAMLAGAKRQCADDDAWLDIAGAMLDQLYSAYQAEPCGDSE